jgi:Transposase DDE domain
LRNLFSFNVDLVFYDLTSTYFEGNGPVGFARHGHSRDGKPRNRQVLVGMVMIEGWPIAHHVFQGNVRDSTTVEKVRQDLQARFGLRRVVLVGDRGMVTSGNLDRLRASGQGYLVGLKRRRQPEILLALSRKDPAKAIEDLQSAAPYERGIAGALYPVYVRGQAYLTARQGREAAAESQKVLEHRGVVGNDPIGALAHLDLARAYGLQDDTTKARAAYQDFFTLWKDADPGIPILIVTRAQ